MERALYELARPGKASLLMPCSGSASLKAVRVGRLLLLAEEAVKRKLVPGIGRGTIRILPESHDLKPWRERMCRVAQLDEEYIARMEEVLAVYEKPLSEQEPVVCMDEKPVVLPQQIRPPLAMKPGAVGRREGEYKGR